MRKSKISRETEETVVDVELNLDGEGNVEVETGISFFDHLLESMGKHGRFDLSAHGEGDFDHHIAEDVFIATGKAFDDALEDKKGIRRMGDAIVPMDDSLAMVALDLGGRVYSDVRVDFEKEELIDLNSDMFVHLLDTFASNSNSNLHVKILRGENDHHKAEAVFKAFGVALSDAVKIVGEEVPSRKGVV